MSPTLDASIEEDGRVQMVRNSFGPGDYETEVIASVAREDKDRLLEALLERVSRRKTRAEDRDRLLLALLKRIYGGNTKAVEEFTGFARSRGIRVDWFRWP